MLKESLPYSLKGDRLPAILSSVPVLDEPSARRPLLWQFCAQALSYWGVLSAKLRETVDVNAQLLQPWTPTATVVLRLRP